MKAAPSSLALTDGYATASTDTGHVGGNARFALGHFEKLIDFGGEGNRPGFLRPRTDEVLAGGKDTEAQLYPADYNGISAGAPANSMTHLQAWSLWVAQAVHKDEASYIPPEKYPVIHKAALDARLRLLTYPCDTHHSQDQACDAIVCEMIGQTRSETYAASRLVRCPLCQNLASVFRWRGDCLVRLACAGGQVIPCKLTAKAHQCDGSKGILIPQRRKGT